MSLQKYKIVAIAQINNELRRGNLERFTKYVIPNVDALVVYDDASTDGSYEYIKEHTPYTIRGIKNSFTNEWQIKQKLVEKALTLNPDFILLIDADEVMTDSNGLKLQELAHFVINNDLDGALIHDINLWRSRSWKRVDSDFDNSHFPRFWRVRSKVLTYSNRTEGFHQSPAPDEIKKLKRQDIISFLHFGFADNKSIIEKYIRYASYGQKGENLARFISEVGFLKTELVDPLLYPEGLHQDDSKPTPLPVSEWYTLIDKYKEELTRPAISIVCLIYQSTVWLQFVYDQVLKHSDLRDKEFFFVANDATPEVKAYLQDNYIPHYIFENTDEHKKDWYINNVYRAWNFGAKMARGDFIMFVNSDMAFSPNWIENSFAHYDGKTCVNSRLVESGNLPTGGLCIEKNFGRHLSEYKEDEFVAYAKEISVPELHDGGAFMPLLIKKSHFIDVGGYPEGNVKKGSDPFSPVIAQKGEELVSGDIILMEKLKTLGVSHKTAFDSFSYHFQEGEMRDVPTGSNGDEDTQVLIINSSLNGKMKEKVLWNFLLEGLPHSSGIDHEVVGANEENFTSKTQEYISSHYPNAQIIIQNASFIDLMQPSIYTIAFLQDDLRRMNRISPQQEETLALANDYVSNSKYTASSYPEYHFNVIPIGVDMDLFKPRNKEELRKKHGFGKDKKIGIFVGDLSEVKGWSEVRKIIESHPEIHFIIVTKGTENYSSSNVSIYKQIPQSLLAELYNSADFFIIGSKVETLCLAAMEACFSGIPVIMRPIGIFADFTNEERDACGIFDENFERAIEEVDRRSFRGREMMLEKNLSMERTLNEWWNIIARTKLTKNISKTSAGPLYSRRSNFRRKIKMIFNKTFIIVLAKRHLTPFLYTRLLDTWRIMKKILIRKRS